MQNNEKVNKELRNIYWINKERLRFICFIYRKYCMLSYQS